MHAKRKSTKVETTNYMELRRAATARITTNRAFVFGLFLAVAASMAFTSGSIANAAIGDVPATGLVGHWKFDENTGTGRS